MNEITPWENPDLPAPFATIEREIEGRKRRFTLWRWDERLVWRDLDYPRLWWATLGVAASLADWESAIESGRFGRAVSRSHSLRGSGSDFGFTEAVKVFGNRKFYAICDLHGGGLARAENEIVWWNFPDPADNLSLKKFPRGPMKQPLWWPGIQIPHAMRKALVSGYKFQILSQIPASLLRMLRDGENARILLLARDITLWHIYNFSNWNSSTEQRLCELNFSCDFKPLLKKVSDFFQWPANSLLHVVDSHPHFSKKELFIVIVFTAAKARWIIKHRLPLPTFDITSRQLDELQLRLRDALRPILTPTEIEEILNSPARL